MPPTPGPRGIDAVLFDRDGTLVADVPYNRDPALVAPIPGARAALEQARQAGQRVGMVTNQSGVAKGLLRASEVDAVNRRVAELLGPFDIVLSCSHGDSDGCACRKPAPGLVLAAAAALGVPPERCAVVGDSARDVEAAERAGATGVLVPGPATPSQDVCRARHVAATLQEAVALLLAGAFPARPVS